MTNRSLELPDIEVDVALMRRFFGSEKKFPELRNPHVEPRVPDNVRATARPSAVMMAVVDDPGGARMIVTRRHRNLRFAGHVCFPGGKIDAEDTDAVAAALREAEEEIGLAPGEVDLLGRLGDYYTHAGYLIAPVVGVVSPPLALSANPAEVDAIYEISLPRVFRAGSYRLTYRQKDRGHYSFHENGIRIAGPTVSIMIGLYEALAAFVAGNP